MSSSHTNRPAQPPAPAQRQAPGPAVSRFGASLLDSAWAEPGAEAARRARRRKPQAHAPFDLCHVGVVLRSVVFVNGVLAIALLFNHAGVQAWLEAFSLAAGVVLPGVLVWLCLACLAKGALARATTPVQWLIGGSLGAVAGGVSWGLGEWTGLEMISGRPWPPPVLAGGAMAWGLTLWLQWREQARSPADAQARLAELQSRIRPHFLFNTLNTALALVRLDPVRAEGVLEDLSELFHVALTETGQSVSLDEEIALARRYLAIEQIRFGDRLKVVWELDAAAGAARLPPLLLQPLVENAVHHGVEPSAEGGQVRIRTRASAGRVHVSIANTMGDAPPRPGHGIALRNVKERLRLMHDVAAQFETRLDEGVFRVHIVLPL